MHIYIHTYQHNTTLSPLQAWWVAPEADGQRDLQTYVFTSYNILYYNIL